MNEEIRGEQTRSKFEKNKNDANQNPAHDTRTVARADTLFVWCSQTCLDGHLTNCTRAVYPYGAFIDLMPCFFSAGTYVLETYCFHQMNGSYLGPCLPMVHSLGANYIFVK